jgi:hypothetical protein
VLVRLEDGHPHRPLLRLRQDVLVLHLQRTPTERQGFVLPTEGGPRRGGLEQRVWEAVESLLGRPEELVAALDRRIEREKNANGNPEREAAAWARRIENVERQRERAQDAYLAGAFTVEELTAKLAALNGQRGTAEKELATCRKRGGKVAELGAARDALLNRRPLLFTAVGEDERRAQAPEERREVYREHRIEVKIGADGEPVVTGLFGEQTLCDTETLSRGAPDQLPAFLRRPLRVGGI